MTLTKYKDFEEFFTGCYAYYPDAVSDVIGSYTGSNNGGSRAHASRFGIVDNKPMYFSGSLNVNVTLPYTLSAAVSGNTNNSIFIWAKHISGYNSILCKTQNATPWSCWAIQTTNARIVIGSTVYSLNFPTHTATEWCLYGITHDRTQLIGYVNGIASTPVSAPGTISNNSPTASAYVPCVASWANDGTINSNYGCMDIGEIFFFNRLLSAKEVLYLYNKTLAGYFNPLIDGGRGVE